MLRGQVLVILLTFYFLLPVLISAYLIVYLGLVTIFMRCFMCKS